MFTSYRYNKYARNREVERTDNTYILILSISNTNEDAALYTAQVPTCEDEPYYNICHDGTDGVLVDLDVANAASPLCSGTHTLWRTVFIVPFLLVHLNRR